MSSGSSSCTDFGAKNFGYDAVLLTAFGGPETLAEIDPFLQRIACQRPIPQSHLAEISRRYRSFGGSPLNLQYRKIIAQLRSRLGGIEIRLGNRNSAPFIETALAELAAGGCRKILALSANPWDSYSSHWQYLGDVAEAFAQLSEGSPEKYGTLTYRLKTHARPKSSLQPITVASTQKMRVDFLPPYDDLPGIVSATAAAVTSLLSELHPGSRPHDPCPGTHLIFTTHSLPLAANQNSGCPDQPGRYSRSQRQTAAKIVAATGMLPSWTFAYQSRSGNPKVPWLTPDICDHIRSLVAAPVKNHLPPQRIIVVPLGFLSDNLEVLWDLDTQAAQIAKQCGIKYFRTATIGNHPIFLDSLAERLRLVLESKEFSCG